MPAKDSKSKFETEFVRYYLRTKPGGRYDWKDDKAFVIDQAADYFSVAYATVRLNEYQEFFVWLQKQVSGFANLHDFSKRCDEWDKARVFRSDDNVSTIELPESFKIRLRAYSAAAGVLDRAGVSPVFRTVTEAASQIDCTWELKVKFSRLDGDEERERHFREYLSSVLGLRDVELDLLDRTITENEKVARRFQGMPLSQRVAEYKRILSQIGKQMEIEPDDKSPKQIANNHQGGSLS